MISVQFYHYQTILMKEFQEEIRINSPYFIQPVSKTTNSFYSPFGTSTFQFKNANHIDQQKLLNATNRNHLLANIKSQLSTLRTDMNRLIQRQTTEVFRDGNKGTRLQISRQNPLQPSRYTENLKFKNISNSKVQQKQQINRPFIKNYSSNELNNSYQVQRHYHNPIPIPNTRFSFSQLNKLPTFNIENKKQKKIINNDSNHEMNNVQKFKINQCKDVDFKEDLRMTIKQLQNQRNSIKEELINEKKLIKLEWQKYQSQISQLKKQIGDKSDQLKQKCKNYVELQKQLTNYYSKIIHFQNQSQSDQKLIQKLQLTIIHLQKENQLYNQNIIQQKITIQNLTIKNGDLEQRQKILHQQTKQSQQLLLLNTKNQTDQLKKNIKILEVQIKQLKQNTKLQLQAQKAKKKQAQLQYEDIIKKLTIKNDQLTKKLEQKVVIKTQTQKQQIIKDKKEANKVDVKQKDALNNMCFQINRLQNQLNFCQIQKNILNLLTDQLNDQLINHQMQNLNKKYGQSVKKLK